MKTLHRVFIEDARQMRSVQDESVNLIVTSPPYPMIEMWDACFTGMNAEVASLLESGRGMAAFELMHQELDKVWHECRRVLQSGGLLCINIGDAVCTVGDEFRMYSNHARIISALDRLGMTQLPDILWRKQTNAPNKFMGSGMLPAGAYVTYEHEYILIFRKGERREFLSEQERTLRRTSAYFWEERNNWFSDVWMDLKGTTQSLQDAKTRKRSAAYPFELAYRLICMHSVYGDTVLDPFLGTGTTVAAAIASGRNSIGVELDGGLLDTVTQTVEDAVAAGRERIVARLLEHQQFVADRVESGKQLKHRNKAYDFPVITAQETDLLLNAPRQFEKLQPEVIEVVYEPATLEMDEAKEQIELFA